jgi:hypothetical protein
METGKLAGHTTDGESSAASPGRLEDLVLYEKANATTQGLDVDSDNESMVT